MVRKAHHGFSKGIQMSLRLITVLIMLGYLFGCGGSSNQGPTMIDTQPPPPNKIEAPRMSHLSPFNTVEADILVVNDIAFVADGIGPLRGFELTNGVIDEISIAGDDEFGATRLEQRDNTIIVKGAAFTSTSTGGQLRFYDAQDLTAITQMETRPDFVPSGGLYVTDDFLLNGGSRGDGITSYRFSTQSTIEIIANETVDGPVSDIVGIDNAVFAISQSDILIYTISSEGRLILGGIYPLTIFAYKAEIADDMLFYSDDNRAKVLDISNPLSPVLLFESVDRIENRQVIPVKYYRNLMFAGGLNAVEVYKKANGVFEKLGAIETENVVTEIGFVGNYLIVINSSRTVSQTVPEGGPSSMEVFDISSLF